MIFTKLICDITETRSGFATIQEVINFSKSMRSPIHWKLIWNRRRQLCCSQCCGSGSVRCFWASWIRIHQSEVWIRLRLRILYHQAKIVRKTLIPTVLWLLFIFEKWSATLVVAQDGDLPGCVDGSAWSRTHHNIYITEKQWTLNRSE